MNSVFKNDFTNYFTICKHKKDHVDTLSSQIITLNTITDIELTLLILKENVSVYFPDFENDSEIMTHLYDKKYSDITLENAGTEILFDNILRLSEKIGIPCEVLNDVLFTEIKVDKELVHKVEKNNVMVSKSKRLPNTNVFYLRGFFDTKEIQLDHKAEDHVESIILTEICRQACLSTSAEALSGEEHFIPTEETKVYQSFVTQKTPLIIQVISDKTAKHKGYCVYALYQNGKCCLKGYMTGRIFRNRKSFEHMRHSHE
ncbi:AfsA-related hotdog domain-containing protein [Streptococcus sanguinis]|uniref:AfsA-related hotdog domain-containing protein n=1 Tax=Streptococcus sanguinis TaxID=1305 RepID=UPI0007798F0E|nr:AfsA-related hotdog domain-containing protein [Streptococcus sanguinis]